MHSVALSTMRIIIILLAGLELAGLAAYWAMLALPLYQSMHIVLGPGWLMVTALLLLEAALLLTLTGQNLLVAGFCTALALTPVIAIALKLGKAGSMAG